MFHATFDWSAPFGAGLQRSILGRVSPEPRIRAAKNYVRLLGLSDEAFQAYRAHFNSSKHRAVAFELDFPEWWAWWQIDDRWSMRGVGHGKLVMARRGDVGPYALHNIYCATHTENIQDIDPTKMTAAQKAVWDARTDEERAAWHLSVRGDGHPKSKAVITPLGRFGSAALAAEAHGITRQHAARMAKWGAPGWRYEVIGSKGVGPEPSPPPA